MKLLETLQDCRIVWKMEQGVSSNFLFIDHRWSMASSTHFHLPTAEAQLTVALTIVTYGTK